MEQNIIERKDRTEAETKAMELAENSREDIWKSKSFLGSIYQGDLDITLAHPYPEQSEEDKKIGDEFCLKVEKWAKENLDGAEIDERGQIPASIFRGLTELGLWGIKIPKEYGGLGMSQTNYMKILGVIASYCGATAATLSAHQSIGLPMPIKLVGTKEQKDKYLPQIVKGAVTAFALTEPDVGSDPANVKTTAELSEDKKHWIINGEKLWCTNGTIADLYVVMARTPDKERNGRMIRQVTAFIVEGRWEGVDVVHKCDFMGIKGMENGLIRFTNVKVPVKNVIGEIGKGLKVALATLNDGRLALPALASSGGRCFTKFITRWAKSRVQWGKPIGEHEPGAEKLAFIAGSTFAMETFTSYAATLSDLGDVDIRMEAAASKLWTADLFWELVDTSIQLRGGRGYETEKSLEQRGDIPFSTERNLRDIRINRILEGTSEIMRLFLAREALDFHLSNAGALFKKSTLFEKLATVGKCILIYPVWYVKLFVGGFFKKYPDLDPELSKQVRWAERKTRKLARVLFHQMIIQGPKLETRQGILGRIVDIGIELCTMTLTIVRVQKEINEGSRDNLDLCLHWCETRQEVVENLFRRIRKNSDLFAVKVAKSLMSKAEILPREDTSNLTPIANREFGSDLASGKQQERMSQ